MWLPDRASVTTATGLAESFQSVNKWLLHVETQSNEGALDVNGKVRQSSFRPHVKSGFFRKVYVAFGAGNILLFPRHIVCVDHVYRLCFHCICRGVDWNDGQDPMVKLDTQLGSFLRFLLFAAIAWLCSDGAQVKWRLIQVPKDKSWSQTWRDVGRKVMVVSLSVNNL